MNMKLVKKKLLGYYKCNGFETIPINEFNAQKTLAKSLIFQHFV
jgi:hypothetical protein